MYMVDGSNRVRFINAATGIITTVAGTGSACCLNAATGDNGAATSATFTQLTTVALDSSNNLYTLDVYDMRVRKVTKATGIITGYAGTSGKAGIY